MADIRRRYVDTKDAAAYMGVCAATFRRMVDALPAAHRPRQKKWPGVSVWRWDLDELDSAFNSASKSSAWDATLGGGNGVKRQNRRVG